MPFIVMKCQLCSCTLKSSHAILTHLNTKKHAKLCKERGFDNIADVALFAPIDPSYLEKIDWADYTTQAVTKALSPPKDKVRPVYLLKTTPPTIGEVPIAKTVEYTPPTGVVNLPERMKGLSVSAPLAVHHIRPTITIR